MSNDKENGNPLLGLLVLSALLHRRGQRRQPDNLEEVLGRVLGGPLALEGLQHSREVEDMRHLRLKTPVDQIPDSMATAVIGSKPFEPLSEKGRAQFVKLRDCLNDINPEDVDSIVIMCLHRVPANSDVPCKTCGKMHDEPTTALMCGAVADEESAQLMFKSIMHEMHGGTHHDAEFIVRLDQDNGREDEPGQGTHEEPKHDDDEHPVDLPDNGDAEQPARGPEEVEEGDAKPDDGSEQEAASNHVNDRNGGVIDLRHRA